jgi:excisionase family DNA binding protein
MSKTKHGTGPAEPGERLFAKVPEAAPMLRLDVATIRHGLERGEIPGFRVGQQWRIPMSWIRQQAGQAS